MMNKQFPTSSFIVLITLVNLFFIFVNYIMNSYTHDIVSETLSIIKEEIAASREINNE